MQIETTVSEFSASTDALIYWLIADRIVMGGEPLSKETIEGLKKISPGEASTKL